jgi:uncharacterized OsmC-like protein
MKITLPGDDAIRLEPTTGALTIEAASIDVGYSPFHMLASALASCTFSALHSWATHKKLSVDDLALDVRWKFADDPHRVSEIRVTFNWPSLPADRVATAKRVAALCTVHATLTHPPHIDIAASTESGGDIHDDTATVAAMHGDPAAAPAAPVGAQAGT